MDFPLLDTNLKIQDQLRQKVRVQPYSGVPLKEGEFPERVDFNNSVCLNTDDLLSSLYYNANNMSSDDLESKIAKSLDYIIHNIYSNEKGYNYFPIFQNPKVLFALKNILSKTLTIDYPLLVDFDSLLMKAFNVTDMNNESLVILYKGLASEVNRDIVKNILKINSRGHSDYPITPNVAMYLAVARYSIFDLTEIVNAERINSVMLINENGVNVFNNQVLIDLYSLLFDSLEGLFFGTIFRSDELRIQMDDDKRKLEIVQVESVLDIMNAQSYNLIRNILMNYTNRFYTMYNGNDKKIKLNLSQIDPYRYSLIARVIYDLSTQAGVYVP